MIFFAAIAYAVAVCLVCLILSVCMALIDTWICQRKRPCPQCQLYSLRSARYCRRCGSPLDPKISGKPE
jgi:hypothetical protein